MLWKLHPHGSSVLSSACPTAPIMACRLTALFRSKQQNHPRGKPAHFSHPPSAESQGGCIRCLLPLHSRVTIQFPQGRAEGFRALPPTRPLLLSSASEADRMGTISALCSLCADGKNKKTLGLQGGHSASKESSPRCTDSPASSRFTTQPVQMERGGKCLLNNKDKSSIKRQELCGEDDWAILEFLRPRESCQQSFRKP